MPVFDAEKLNDFVRHGRWYTVFFGTQVAMLMGYEQQQNGENEMKIKSNLTKKETGIELAECVRDYFLDEYQVDVLVGLDTDGDIGEWNPGEDCSDMAAVYFDSRSHGDCNIIDGDHSDPVAWSAEMIEGLGELLVNDWAPVDEDGFTIDIEYRKEKDNERS